MRRFTIQTLLSALVLLAPSANAQHIEPFPETKNLELGGYSYGEEIPFECIQRNMETGEHKFDEQGNIIYAPFPKCFETDAPLTLRYGVDEVFNCTIDLGHEFFHIFQLYIHEDVPFSCRIPFTKTQNPSPAPPADSPEEKAAKLYTSFTFNIRGRVQESHLDIDPFLNMAAVVNTTAGSVTSAIAFSSGSTVQRFIIGDPLPLTLAVRWYPGPVLPTAKGAYFAGSATFYYSTATFIITAAACAAIFYYYVFPKKLREELKTTLPIAGQYYNTKSE